MDKQYEPYSPNRDYNAINPNPSVHYGVGVIPAGVSVLHKADKDGGRVINSNNQKAQVNFGKEFGYWYENSDLLVPTS